MPLCTFSGSYFMLGVTPVENIFIQNFLPHAPGDYVRVYLYGLMQCHHPADDMTLERMAHLLGMEESAVQSAFQYWERQGLVQRVSDNPPAYEYLNLAFSMNDESPMEKAVYRHRDFNTRMQQLFGTRLLHPAEFMAACEWVEELHLPEQVVLVMVEHFIAQKGRSFQFRQLEKTAMQWAERGICTVEAAQEMLARDSAAYKTAQKVLERFNLRRGPTKEEADMARKWLEEWGMTEEAVLAACRETVKGRNPSFGYLDGILAKNRGARSVDDMSRQLEEKEKLRKAVKDIHEALGIQQASVSEEELDAYRNYLAAGFEAEGILRLARAIGRQGPGRYSMETIDAKLTEFVEKGLKTDMQIAEYLDQQRLLREQALRVYKASGQDALVTNASAAQMEEWLALASFPVVLFAAECAQGTRLPSQYITKLLREWKKAGVTTVEEARRQRAAQRPAPVGLQYEQRAYTEDEMKKFTVDLSQYSEDKKP